MVGPGDDPNLTSRPLCEYPMAFLASAGIPFPQTKIELEEIVRTPLITFARKTKPYKDLQALLDEHGLRATIHVSASLEVMVGMALDGLAIAFIPPAAIESRADARERLRPLDTTVNLPSLPYVVSLPKAHVRDAAQKVADIALAIAKEMYGTGPS